MGFFTGGLEFRLVPRELARRNPFQGGMGFFTWEIFPVKGGAEKAKVAIPFRVGWGFSQITSWAQGGEDVEVAIPFRVGWGFSLGS